MKLVETRENFLNLGKRLTRLSVPGLTFFHVLKNRIYIFKSEMNSFGNELTSMSISKRKPRSNFVIHATITNDTNVTQNYEKVSAQ